MTGTIRERFEAKFTKAAGCWNWTARKDHKGYGQFHFAGRTQTAHRVAYQLYIGEIPEGLCVLHHCDNRRCTNPAHLFLGTNADNVHDCISKGRWGYLMQPGEKHYKAKLTEKQVIEIRSRYASGERGNDLARELGVTQSNVSQIVTRRTWTSV